MRESRERWVKEGKGLVKMGRIRRRDKRERDMRENVRENIG